jgi:esterase/lipase superfamily enzyme
LGRQDFSIGHTHGLAGLGNAGRRKALLLVCGLLIVALFLAAFFHGPGGKAQAQTALSAAEVSFLTVRNRTGSDDPARYFGDLRGTLSAGTCRIRSLEFGALVPLAHSAPAYVQEEFLRIDTVQEVPRMDIINRFSEGPQARSRAIYVHGYNIGFEKGCRRAALLQKNARLEDRMLWFSWPSDGAVTNYMRDEADLYWSVPDLADTILDLAERVGEPLDVMGHSLGARGVVLALSEVANRQPDIRLGEVVLLAPDMDFEIFERFLPRIRPISASLTVYVTDGDRPLALSEQLHGYPRLGQAANDVSVLAGVEVIDLSALDVEDLTGHLYHIFSPEVGDDLDRLLNKGMRAAERPGLSQTGANRWRMDGRPRAGSE